MIEDEYKTRGSFVLISVTKKTSHLISTKREEQVYKGIKIDENKAKLYISY